MIKFLDVHKRFKDGTVALKDVSFHIDPGEFVVVTGPSGSGKTTLMKLLIKDLAPTKGDILFEGESLSGINDSLIPLHRRKVGVVFQDYRLLPELNVWENIALPLAIASKSEEEIESRITDLLTLVSLEEKALMFPKQLSGGEAQRVGIARALATGPGIIFADEPTGNLDKKSSLSLVKLLQQINELGTTIILSTHDVTLLDFLRELRLIELDKGSLIVDKDSKKPKKTVSKEKTSKEKPSKEKTPKKSKDAEEKKSEKGKKKEKGDEKDEGAGEELKTEDKVSEEKTESDKSEKKSEKKPAKKFKKMIRLPFFGKKKKIESEQSKPSELEEKDPENGEEK